MKILIAEDDPSFRHLLAEILGKWGYDSMTCRDGNEAWQALNTKEAPRLVILDWMMPGIDGVELCRKIRMELPKPYTYIILLTSHQKTEDLVTGMEAGADDYITKPLKINELRVRLNAGRRTVELQDELALKITELETTLSKIKQLEGIIPICMYCKKIRDDKESWQHLEKYITEHSEALFSHGICPDCAKIQMEKFADFRTKNTKS